MRGASLYLRAETVYLSAVSQLHQAVLLACSTHCSGDRGHAPGSLNEKKNNNNNNQSKFCTIKHKRDDNTIRKTWYLKIREISPHDVLMKNFKLLVHVFRIMNFYRFLKILTIAKIKTRQSFPIPR